MNELLSENVSVPVARGERPADLRVAGAHLRLGHHALARAQLEAIAQRGGLDRDGLADLAEARWRTGDLRTAGQAAEAYLEAGGEDVVSLVIAAEGATSDGRIGDARALVETVRRRAVDLDAVFAGLPRGRLWRGPGVAQEGPEAQAARPSVPAGAALAGSSGSVAPMATERAPANARELIAFAAAALRDDPGRAAIELSVVLRLEPSLAPAVLELVARREDGRPSRSAAALEIVRGDAFRLIGRPREADQAYSRAEALLAGLEGTSR